MTSLKSLVDNDCGSQNPLLKLASHYTSDRTLLNQDGIKSLKSQDTNTNADGYVNEYLNEATTLFKRNKNSMPQTFHMENIFNELLCIDNNNQITNNLTNINLKSFDWSNEYSSQMQNQLNITDLQWSTDYLTQRESLIYDDTWENLIHKNNLQSQTNESFLNDEMKKTANELLDSMQDSRFSETEFLKFVKDLNKTKDDLNKNDEFMNKTNNLNSKLGDDDLEDEKLWNDTLKQVQESISKSEIQTNNEQIDNVNEWVDDFINSKNRSDSSTFWDDLNDEWMAAAKSNPDHPWLDDFQTIFDTYKSYEFDKENPLLTHSNPFEEGLNRLKSHDIVNAVLLFEAAVKKEPNNMLAWQYLGTTQVENEQDAQAIRALKKCLELKPDNLTALSTLATSYTNESMQRLAYDCLYKWLESNAKYSHLVKNKLLPSITQTQLATLSIVHIKDFIDLQEVYLEAVRESTNIDPDLQCCLGVLFHLSGEYDKAADCFKTALQIKPNDHLLWNKLGATYANNNRNEEAIEAYYNALQLCPGFVRARYNLGIGCMNLGAYKESIEHFLTALSQQSQVNIKNPNEILANKQNQMSETIWSTLRLALSYLNRNDLYQQCANKDIEYLKQQFNIE